MDRSVNQALHGLVPGLSGPLPQELVGLATSLLAQSRSRASSLKAEEEIARTYACANIACERLKQSLSLPKIEPRPPCPPRVYQKLYRYLETALPAEMRESNRESRKSKHTSTPNTTPQKRTADSTTVTTSRSGKRFASASRRTVVRQSAARENPDWVMPIIRRLCRKLGQPAAPHHVFAGISSILAIQSDASSVEEALGTIKVPALIIAVYFYVISRMAGVEIKPERLLQQTNVSLALMRDHLKQGLELEPIDESDVHDHMRQIASMKWVEMDWFRNIELGSGAEQNSEEAGSATKRSVMDENEGEDEDDEASTTRPRYAGDDNESVGDYLRPGLGTMMQEKVDLLSDDHHREFQEWKADVLSRIRAMEQQ